MFTNKVVLVTGASSGIGAETALEFSKLNANLVITARNKENLQNIAKQCEARSPSKLKPLAVISDISKEEDVEDLIKETIDHFNRLDVLVNNAGVGAFGSILNTSLKQYDLVMATNMRGSFYLTMLAMPHLIRTKGNIVNVSSLAGRKTFRSTLVYSLSKAALDHFTRCVALDVGSKSVRVNSVNPGHIDTGIHLKSGISKEQYEVYLKNCKASYPLGKTGIPKEVASTIVFLAGEGASNITGANVPVDGGNHLTWDNN